MKEFFFGNPEKKQRINSPVHKSVESTPASPSHAPIAAVCESTDVAQPALVEPRGDIWKVLHDRQYTRNHDGNFLLRDEMSYTFGKDHIFLFYYTDEAVNHQNFISCLTQLSNSGYKIICYQDIGITMVDGFPIYFWCDNSPRCCFKRPKTNPALDQAMRLDFSDSNAKLPEGVSWFAAPQSADTDHHCAKDRADAKAEITRLSSSTQKDTRLAAKTAELATTQTTLDAAILKNQDLEYKLAAADAAVTSLSAENTTQATRIAELEAQSVELAELKRIKCQFESGHRQGQTCPTCGHQH